MELAGSTIAVTGATGFLGRYIVKSLLERGARVVGVVRNPDRVPELARQGVEMRRADLKDRAALARGFAGTHAVVSNAALYSLQNRDLQEHQRTNIEGTENVLEAAAEAGVRRVVHVSSCAVYGISLRKLDENAEQLGEHTRPRFWNAYPISKALSEQLGWRKARELGLDLTTVRPCAIYGAFDTNFMPILERLLRLPVLPTFTRLPLVYGGDVADAIARALASDASIGKAYNITGEDRSLAEFMQAWREAGGRGSRFRIPIPLPLRQSFDRSRAETELGWRNRPFVDALRETFDLERRR